MCPFILLSGETGIRTRDPLRETRFPGVRLKPLGHLSNSASIDFAILYTFVVGAEFPSLGGRQITKN